MDGPTDGKSHSSYRYRFGTAEFNEARFELQVAGISVDVQRKPLEILRYLLRRAGEVVTKDELLDGVWEGRPTVENVVATALAKLRSALGEENAARIVTQARVGYRLTGHVERIAVGRALSSVLILAPEQLVPGRDHFLLESLIGQSLGSEVWLARHTKTGERRVYKFSRNGEQLAALKREVTLSRVLQEGLGQRDAFVRIIDWNFAKTPFFLECEYGGQDLATWAEAERHLELLPSPQRLGVFQQIVDAVAAAHSVGVLHKDLKPSNVLIAPRAEAWQVRVTDFGSGRLLEPDRLAALGITELGMTVTQSVLGNTASGTPLYLAPEILAGQPPTVQSDVYALGLLLYQLVVGDLRKPMAPGWDRDVPDELLREDVAAATDGNPAHRLASAAELAERLRNLKTRRDERMRRRSAEEMVRTATEALQRSRARRPWIIVLTSTLTLGLVATSWLYYRELHTHRLLVESEAQVRKVAGRAEAVTQFLDENVLSSSDPFLGEVHQKVTIKTALDDAAASLGERFVGDPQTEASIRMALGTVYIRILESEAAVIQWQRVVALIAATAPPIDPRLISSRYYLAQALALASHFDAAQNELLTADRSRLSLQSDPQLELLSHRSWGLYFLNLQQCDRGVPQIEQAVLMLKRLQPSDVSSLDLTRILLGQCYTGVSRFKDSERVATDLIADVQRRNKPSDLTLALAKYVYGESLTYQQRYGEAEPALDEAYRVAVEKLGADNFRVLTILNARCALYSASDQNLKAVDCMEEAYRLTRQRHGDEHWSTSAILANLGVEQFVLKRYDAAAKSLSIAHGGLAKALGPDKPLTLFSAYYLARTYIRRGDADRAATLAGSLTPEGLSGAEPGAPWDKRLGLLQGLILAEQRQTSEALAALRPVAHMSTADDPNDSIIREAQIALHHIESRNIRASSAARGQSQ
jgi:serine/threonine protein kinase/DNA-binding winged helix-turn-helix (wHTH) protein